MAMTVESLVSRLKAKYGTPPTAEGVAQQDAALRAQAEALLDEIHQNGSVPVPAAGILAPNGACTGAATGTIL